MENLTVRIQNAVQAELDALPIKTIVDSWDTVAAATFKNRLTRAINQLFETDETIEKAFTDTFYAIDAELKKTRRNGGESDFDFQGGRSTGLNFAVSMISDLRERVQVIWFSALKAAAGDPAPAEADPEFRDALAKEIAGLQARLQCAENAINERPPTVDGETLRQLCEDNAQTRDAVQQQGKRLTALEQFRDGTTAGSYMPHTPAGGWNPGDAPVSIQIGPTVGDVLRETEFDAIDSAGAFGDKIFAGFRPMRGPAPVRHGRTSVAMTIDRETFRQLGNGEKLEIGEVNGMPFSVQVVGDDPLGG